MLDVGLSGSCTPKLKTIRIVYSTFKNYHLFVLFFQTGGFVFSPVYLSASVDGAIPFAVVYTQDKCSVTIILLFTTAFYPLPQGQVSLFLHASRYSSIASNESKPVCSSISLTKSLIPVSVTPPAEPFCIISRMRKPADDI